MDDNDCPCGNNLEWHSNAGSGLIFLHIALFGDGWPCFVCGCVYTTKSVGGTCSWECVDELRSKLPKNTLKQVN